MTLAKSAASAAVHRLGLAAGTHPENLAALRLHRAGIRFVQQHRVGRYRIDFALPEVKVAVEVDGPHHHRPDVAQRDALRDAWLRSQGWLVFRVTAGEDRELVEVCRVLHLIVEHGR